MYVNKKLITFMATLTMIISTVFAIAYFPSENVFNVSDIGITHDENLEYKVTYTVDTIVEEDLVYDIEIIYLKTNLVVGVDKFTCSDSCSRTVDLIRDNFGDHKVIVTARHNGRFYRDEKKFNIESKTSAFTLNTPEKIVMDPIRGIDSSIGISSSYDRTIEYTLEIAPRSRPENKSIFNQVCLGDCEIPISIKNVVIDTYDVNVISTLGDARSSFELVLPFESTADLYERVKEKTNKKELKDFTSTDSKKKLSEYYFYTDVSKDVIEVEYTKNNSKRYKSEIIENETIDISFKFLNNTVKEIVVPDAKTDNVSIGFENIPEELVPGEFNGTIKNSFAIDPLVNPEVENYELTFVAQGTEFYKCEDYNFVQRDCFGDYIKVMDTIPDVEYTINLTPKDPIFVEILDPFYKTQIGSVTVNSLDTSTTIEAVNRSQTFVVFTARSTSSSGPAIWHLTPYFSDSTTLNFDRYNSANDVEALYYVVESDQFTVQHGVTTFASGNGSATIPINSTNPSETFVIVYGRCADTTTSDNHAGFFMANLTNSTHLYLERGNEGKCAATARWQVVQYTGATVQKGLTSFGGSDLVANAGINAVNRSRSFLVHGVSSTTSTDPGMDSNLIRGTLSSDTNVQLNRDGNSGTSTRDVTWYVVEHDDMLVDRRTGTVYAADTSQTVSVTNTSKAFIISSIENTGGGQTYRNSMYDLNLTSTTNVDIDKETTSQTNTMDWFIIEFLGNDNFDPRAQVTLNATSVENLLIDNLTCNYELGGDVTSVFTNWIINGTSMNIFALPMEGNASNALIDRSNSSNDFSTNGAIIWNSTGGYDGNASFEFDGIDDYLNSSNNVYNPSSFDWTLTARFRIDELPTGGNNAIILDQQDGTGNGRAYLYINSSGGLMSGLGGENSYSGVTVNTGQWYFVALAKTTGLQWYVNDTTQNQNFVSVESATGRYIIGANETGSSDYFNGSIDDVRIYNRSLSAEQIQNIYNKRDINRIYFEETLPGEQWQCAGVPFNTQATGQTYFSNTLNIIGAEVKYNQTTLDITGAIASYQPATDIVAINALVINHTNISVACESGDCSTFTENVTNGVNYTLGSMNDISFTCDATVSGSYSALFSVVSNEDTSIDTINVSCIATELPLFVTMYNPNTSAQFDITQNETYNTSLNVTCNNPGGCANIDVGIYYEKESIGEAGSIDLSNFVSQSITFTRSYNETPIVIAIPATDNDGDNNSLIPVTTNITTTGFDIVLCEDTGSSTCDTGAETETVHYYVFDVNASNNKAWLDVGYINSVTTNGVGVGMSFGKTFTNTPYVFAQAQTDADGGQAMAPSGWFSATSTVGGTFVGCDHPGIANDCAGDTTENYGYVAIDPVLANITGLSIGTVTVDDSNWETATFSQSYTNPIVQVYQNSETGTQDPQNPWARDVQSSSARVRYCEQDAEGVCNSHGGETVRWMALESGLITIGNTSDYAVDTTSGAVPFWTSSSNPQTISLGENTSQLVNFTTNASGAVDVVYRYFGELDNGVDTQTLNARILADNQLLFGIYNLTIGTVFQGEGLGINQTTLWSRYSNNNITLSCIGGNCSQFSTGFTNGTNYGENITTDISFACSDTTLGNHSALFNISSNEVPNGDTINLSCGVVLKPLDIDMLNPLELSTSNKGRNDFFLTTFNVTCNNASGCDDVGVFPAYVDLNKEWWNRSFEYRQNITVNPYNSTNGNYFTFLVNFTGPTIGSEFDWSRTCNDVRFAHNMTELNYWIEECSLINQRARIWVTTHVGLNTTDNYDVQMYYGNDTVSTTSNGTNTFIFFEDFEGYPSTADSSRPSTWSAFSSGDVVLQTESDGNRVLRKINNDDPSGGFANFGSVLGNYSVRWKTNRINTVGEGSNRYAISDTSANGYGPSTSNYAGTTTFDIEERASGTPTTIDTGSTWSGSQATWYTEEFTLFNGEINHSIYDSGFTQLNTQSVVDTTYSSFSRFYIHGGQEFETDDIAVRYRTQLEPVVSFTGSYDTVYSPMPTSSGSTPLWTNGTIPQYFNLTDGQSINVSYYVNMTDELNTVHDILGYLSNGDRTEYATINIFAGDGLTNLRLETQINRLSSFTHEINLSLKNLANDFIGSNKSINVYAFLYNGVNVTTPYLVNSNEQTTSITNTTLNDPRYNGTMIEFNITLNETNGAVFIPYDGTNHNNSNTWTAIFNISVPTDVSYSDMILIGFDPEDTSNKRSITILEKEKDRNLNYYFYKIIIFFQNLFSA